MFKMISLAMHFSPLNPGPVDATVMEMLRLELSPKSPQPDNVVELESAKEETTTRKAA